MPKPNIQHLHLPGLIPYAHASGLQSHLVSKLLAFKACFSGQTAPFPQPPPPIPTILTFTPQPVYTHGRRDPNPPSSSQLNELLEPLKLQNYGTLTPIFSNDLRGGQTTFHGPGQLVVWPVFVLDRPYAFAQHQSSNSDGTAQRERLTPTCYVNLLEGVTIAILRGYGLESTRTSDPGVWTSDGERKIAALGVHLRRNCTSFGVGLNIETDARWWKRIVACGLTDKGVSSMRDEGVQFCNEGESRGDEDARIEEVAEIWVGEFAKQVGADVTRVEEDAVWDGEEMKLDVPDLRRK